MTDPTAPPPSAHTAGTAPRISCAGIVHQALALVMNEFRLDLHDPLHGLAHWSRVWFHGRALAAALDLNPAVLAWFAFLHDSQRQNNGSDPRHGPRAAAFAWRLRRQGMIADLDQGEFERLCEAMRLHSDHARTTDPLICACWDADRLDLGRVNITPDPKRLCTDFARHPTTIARAMRMVRPIPRPHRGL